MNTNTNTQGGPNRSTGQGGQNNNQDRKVVSQKKVGFSWANPDIEGKKLTPEMISEKISEMLVDAGLKDPSAIKGTRVTRKRGDKSALISTSVDLKMAEGIIESKRKAGLFRDDSINISKDFLGALRNKAFYKRLNYTIDKNKIIFDWDPLILLSFLTDTVYGAESVIIKSEPYKTKNNNNSKDIQPCNLIFLRESADAGFNVRQVIDFEEEMNRYKD